MDTESETSSRQVRIDQVLAALWAANRHAKRYRDKAQTHYQSGNHRWAGWCKQSKERVYALKGQVLHYLVATGVLAPDGCHKIGGLYAEVLRGHGYTFHRPCQPPVNTDVPDLGEQLEARPRGAKEIGIIKARAILAKFLADKPVVTVYQWPPKERVSRYRPVYCWECGGEGHIASECDGTGGDDDDRYDDCDLYDDD